MGLQEEWQFEICNSLPSDKAVALVNLIKSSEKERAQAITKASQLQKEVQQLKTPRQSETDLGMSSAEWQYEILNSLPREKAVALIELLENTDREKQQAQSIVAALQREVHELK